eukprot:TRINITY_DN77232_c0_g1_i1.p1 TRINITY_DN77232_c0_g1~~TRINITY_DN77232_c0_g1_i1.p1  ORF type:complete len:225 (+),score=66.18 TRINITY_DN77232_c0_g1_i1:100-774(+)
MADSQVVLSTKNVRLTKGDVSLLQPGQWLNDRCITFYLDYLAEQRGSAASRVLLLGAETAFWILNEEDEEDLADAAEGLELAEKDLILCPLNDNADVTRACGGSHWSLLAARVSKSGTLECEYYDSMGTGMLDIARRLSKKLAALRFPGSAASAAVSVAACGKQDNQSDCGVYVLLFAQAVLESYLQNEQGCGRAASIAPADATKRRKDVIDAVHSEAARLKKA